MNPELGTYLTSFHNTIYSLSSIIITVIYKEKKQIDIHTISSYILEIYLDRHVISKHFIFPLFLYNDEVEIKIKAIHVN